MNRFPYEGKSQFTTSADPAVQELQQASGEMQAMLLGLGRVDPDLKLLARFDQSLEGHLGQAGTGTGPLRYWEGRFSGSQGVLVESAGENLLINPSAELDLSGWSADDAAVELTRATTPTCQENGVVSNGSFQLAGTGKTGLGFVKSSVAVSQDRFYSASVHVYSQQAVRGRLQLAFTGGTPVDYDTGEVVLTPGQWTRLELPGKASNDNDTAELRIHLVQLQPEFTAGSRLARVTPSGTAPVTDEGLGLVPGDVVMVATTANPSGSERYSWHLVTTGATGVSSSALRLDDAPGAPTFPLGSRLSRWQPSVSIPASDGATPMNLGDLVFCRLLGQDYAWHLVTTAGTATSPALRLDDAPAPPDFVAGSRVSLFMPLGTAPASDVAMPLGLGDLVMAYTLAPGGEEYRFHLVTTGAPGVSSPLLRLDDSPTAPVFASGSRVSKFAASSAPVADEALVLAAGDFVFASPSRNPVGQGYGWHLVTTGATGVASPDLRLDGTSSDVLFADAAQLEEAETVSSYIDSYQGAGFTGSLGSRTGRAASTLAYAGPGNLSGPAGTVAFWMRPLWAGDDDKEHVLFDAAVDDNRDRLRISKSRSNELVLSLYDTQGQLAQVVSSAPVSFMAGTWQHLGFTWSGGLLKVYHGGLPLPITPVGAGTGQMTQVPTQMFLGSDFRGAVSGGAVFDELVLKGGAASEGEMRALASAAAPYQGQALAAGGFALGTGVATTHGTPGTQTAVAHGLGVTPSFVQLTPHANGVVYLSAPADATSFQVKGSAASLEFSWRAFA